jgi:hypothetical protein
MWFHVCGPIRPVTGRNFNVQPGAQDIILERPQAVRRKRGACIQGSSRSTGFMRSPDEPTGFSRHLRLERPQGVRRRWGERIQEPAGSTEMCEVLVEPPAEPVATESERPKIGSLVRQRAWIWWKFLACAEFGKEIHRERNKSRLHRALSTWSMEDQPSTVRRCGARPDDQTDLAGDQRWRSAIISELTLPAEEPT